MSKCLIAIGYFDRSDLELLVKCDTGYSALGDSEIIEGEANCLDGLWKAAANTSIVLKDEGGYGLQLVPIKILHTHIIIYI